MQYTTKLGLKKPELTDYVSVNDINENMDVLDDAIDRKGVPSGLISMWSGAINAIPAGWALCDGSKGTPNLIDRFIVGAGRNYSVGNTGGADTVSLTTAQLPAHNHAKGTLATSSNGSHSHSGTTSSAGLHSHPNSLQTITTVPYGVPDGTKSVVFNLNNYDTNKAGDHTHNLSINSSGSHTHTINGSTAAEGGGGSHENRPPYFALAYIMKL